MCLYNNAAKIFGIIVVLCRRLEILEGKMVYTTRGKYSIYKTSRVGVFFWKKFSSRKDCAEGYDNLYLLSFVWHCCLWTFCPFCFIKILQLYAWTIFRVQRCYKICGCAREITFWSDFFFKTDKSTVLGRETTFSGIKSTFLGLNLKKSAFLFIRASVGVLSVVSRCSLGKTMQGIREVKETAILIKVIV